MHVCVLCFNHTGVLFSKKRVTSCLLLNPTKLLYIKMTLLHKMLENSRLALALPSLALLVVLDVVCNVYYLYRLAV